MKNYNNISNDRIINRTDIFLLPEYKEIVDDLIENQPKIASVAIVEKSKDIAYSTTDWDLNSVLEDILAVWGQKEGKYLTIGGKSYRIFQNTPDRLAASLISGTHDILGFKDNEWMIVCKVSVDKDNAVIVLMNAFMEMGRSLGRLSSKKPFMDPSMALSKSDKIEEVMPKFLFDTTKILQRLGLQKFGLTPEEAGVYLELLKKTSYGEKVSNLNKKLDIKRPTLYKMLDRLVDKNWVDVELRTSKRTQFYIARPIAEVFDRIIQEKIEEIKILKSFQLLIKEYLGNGWESASKFYDDSQTFSREVFDIDMLGMMGLEKDFGILVFEYDENIVDEIRAQDKLSLIHDKIIEQMKKLKEQGKIQDFGTVEKNIKIEYIEIQENHGANIFLRFKEGSSTARQLGKGWIIAVKAVVIPIENLIYVIWGSEEKFQTLLDLFSNLK